MYTRRNNLSLENITVLETLKNSVPYISNSTRIGKNNFDGLSVYEFSKWKTWNRDQRKSFKQCFETADIDKSVIGWFLKFPANKGFLDTMTAWQDVTVAGTIVAYSLTENNNITINGEKIAVDKGHGLEFSLKNAHSVSALETEGNWACLMLMK